MRATITLNAELLAEAQRITGTKDRNRLIHEALKALVERERARPLAEHGGSEQHLRLVPLDRDDPATKSDPTPK